MCLHFTVTYIKVGLLSKTELALWGEQTLNTMK